MSKIFESIFSNGDFSVIEFLICILSAIFIGIIFSFMCYYKSNSSKSFLVTTALLPATVAIVIALINGNIGAGIATAGAFGLVRFRSAPGKAKEICIIFIAMATGLAFGMGYILYGTLFTLICGSTLMILNKVNIWERETSNKERIYKITILEDVDYINEFSDVFNKYTSKCELIKVKMINMGSMFRLTYKIILKDDKLEKEFIDAIRTRNSNLEIISERLDLEYSDCDL